MDPVRNPYAPGAGQRPGRHTQARPGRIEMAGPRTFPDPVPVPQTRPAIDCGEHRTDDAHAAARGQVDLDARFVERAEYARVVGAGRARADEQQCGPTMR